MALSLEGDILKVLEQLKQEIRINMQTQRVNASGRTSASLRVEKFDGGMRLVGGTEGTHPVPDYPAWRGTAEAPDTAPIPTLEFGRQGGGVPRGFYYIIRKWSRAKGLQFRSESDRGTFAYFVTRKIAREGTHRNRDNADIYSTPVMNAKDRINEVVKASVQNTLRAALGGMNVTNLRGAFTD